MQQPPSRRRSSGDSSSSESISSSRGLFPTDTHSPHADPTLRWQDGAILKALSEIQLNLQQGNWRNLPEASKVLVCSSADEAEDAEDEEERTTEATNLDSTKLWNFVPRKLDGLQPQYSESSRIALTCIEPNFSLAHHAKHSDNHAPSRNEAAHRRGVLSEAATMPEVRAIWPCAVLEYGRSGQESDWRNMSNTIDRTSI